jgi:hypothetical protein
MRVCERRGGGGGKVKGTLEEGKKVRRRKETNWVMGSESRNWYQWSYRGVTATL